jgi:hypothetical protein
VHRSPAGPGAYNPETHSSTPRDPVTLIQPFAALRPAPGRAAEVIAPPYDVVSTDEARHLAAGRPWSFLHVSRPEIDLAPGTGILAVGAGEKRPVVKNDALAIATVMTCQLSVDHRVVDGALAAEFMATLKALIENPLSLML